MAPKKDKTFTFRLTKEDKLLFDKFSIDSNRPLSTFMRDAIRNYMYMFYVDPKLGNPQIVFSKNIIAKMFSYLNIEQIEEISKIAYGNASNSFENYKQILDLEQFSTYNAETFAEHLKNIGKRVYSSMGQNWLENFDFRISGHSITVFATHNLGENFSRFFEFAQSKHAQKFNYKLESSRYYRKKSSRTDSEEKDHFVLIYIKIQPKA